MPLSPESKREAEKRLTVLKVIELFSDRCPKSTLLNGPFGGDDKAFDRWLGLMRRTYQIKLVMAVQEERATLYSRTEAGKVYQNMLDMQLNFLDPYTGGEVWENHTEARQTLSHLLLRSIIPGLIRIFSSCERFRFLGYNGIPRRTEYYLLLALYWPR